MSDDTVWLRSSPDIDGTYRLTLEVDQDSAYTLDSATAAAWADYVLATLARADYDAAVIRQLTEVCSADPEAKQIAVQMVGDLRKDRPELTSPLPELVITAGVSVFSGDGFLTIRHRGKSLGQWELDDARGHAAGVIEIRHGVELDSAYLRGLIGVIGLDEGRARAVVGDLGKWRRRDASS